MDHLIFLFQKQFSLPDRRNAEFQDWTPRELNSRSGCKDVLSNRMTHLEIQNQMKLICFLNMGEYLASFYLFLFFSHSNSNVKYRLNLN